MCQTIEELQLAGFCSASSYFGMVFCKVLFCPKLLMEYNFEAPVLCQAIAVSLCIRLLGNYNLQVLSCPKLLGGLQLAGAIPARHIFSTREISFRLRFIIHVKHAPYCGDSASSSYTLNTPLMRRFRFIIYLKVLQTSLSIGRDRFIIRLKHAPSSHLLNTTTHLPIPILHFR